MMDWTSILTTLAGLLLGGGGSILYYGPKLKEANLGVAKASTQYLEERIAAQGKLYEEQGKLLDEMRQRILEMNRTMIEKDELISKQGALINSLTEKVTVLEKELAAYKVINKK